MREKVAMNRDETKRGVRMQRERNKSVREEKEIRIKKKTEE